MPAFEAIASRRGLAVVEDACQAHGATCAGRPVGTFGVAGAFSFYPTKNLGALGDAGAVATNDAPLAERLKRLRNGGQTDRYHHPEFGVNSRLDEMQAAVLRARLPLLAAGNARRRAIAARYRAALAHAPVIVPPECDPGHVYHLFPILVGDRDAFQAHLAAQGIGTLVHYPVPLPRQEAFASYSPAACPIADRVCADVCSLPLHPRLPDADVDAVAAAVLAYRGTRGSLVSGVQ
jgi:dTDP-3-amino-3,4,6-trideoxy-alpha-D-glucose transaminase